MGTYTRRNNLLGDPRISEGFSDLAKAFAPPSGSDLYGYAHAALAKQQFDNTAKFMGLSPDDPQYKSLADQFSVGAGHDPNYYKIDSTNSTSRANNADDNSRALGQTRMQQEGETGRELLKPVIVGEGQTALIPDQRAKVTGLPGMFVGAIKTGQGDTVTLPTAGADGGVATGAAPGGPVIKGPDKPLTEEQIKGAILGRLPENEQRQVITGGAVDKSVLNYTGPNGEVGTAARDLSGNLLDTQTGKPIPAQSRIFNATATGTPGQMGKMTERDSVLALAGENMAPGLAILNQAYSGNKSVSSGALAVKQLFGDNPAIKDMAQRSGIINPDDQAIMGGINSVMNYLYLQTGAARTPGEDERGYSELVPLESDTPQNRQLKRDLFNQKAMSIINQAKDPSLKAKLVQAMSGAFQSPVSNDTQVGPSASAAPVASNPATGGNVSWVLKDGKLVKQ